MASEGPDPKTFLSWEDAFQYPIPAVRGMEKQLRRDIEANREKLRTLVGYVMFWIQPNIRSGAWIRICTSEPLS